MECLLATVWIDVLLAAVWTEVLLAAVMCEVAETDRRNEERRGSGGAGRFGEVGGVEELVLALVLALVGMKTGGGSESGCAGLCGGELTSG